ncbi:MAG: hypothetical protein QG608_1915 [Actinomycetota bacterium]|nr:hypothetical protein [Actinomycetota bacterium]
MAERRRAVAPDTGHGKATTPDRAARQEGTAPGEAGPSVPEGSVPEGSAPESSVPESSVPWLGSDKEAGTRELREALESLRVLLESRPEAPRPAHRGPRSSLGPRWTTVGVVALVGLGLALVLPGAGDDGSLGAPPVPRSSSPDPRRDDLPQAPSPSPLRWPGGPVSVPPGIPQDGPGVDAPGTDLTIAFDTDGQHLDVFERVSFPDPRTDVRLRLPSLSAVWGPRTAVPTPTVQDLQVEIDGRPVLAERARDGAWVARAGRNGATGVVLRYRVDRSVLRLPGSPSGRVLAVVPSLTGQENLRDGLPVTVRISDRRVVGLSCLPGAGDGTDAAATMCAAPAGSAWTAQLPLGGAALALVQANLPG